MTTAIVLSAAALIAGVDQIIKYYIYANLRPIGRMTVIDNLLTLVYSENKGAAFGIFQDGTLFFIIITSLLIGVFLYLLITKKFKGKMFNVSVALILGGGIGNLIDRIFRHFVIDYLSLSFFPPICNFADYCITVGAAIFVLSMMITPEIIKGSNDKKEEASENE